MTALEGMILCLPNEWSTKQIAVACGCSQSSVHKTYRKHGMPRPRPGAPTRNLERREFEIRYGVTRRFWRNHTIACMLACHESARDWYVQTWKEANVRVDSIAV